jgi:hypothetical protein
MRFTHDAVVPQTLGNPESIIIPKIRYLIDFVRFQRCGIEDH